MCCRRDLIVQASISCYGPIHAGKVCLAEEVFDVTLPVWMAKSDDSGGFKCLEVQTNNGKVLPVDAFIMGKSSSNTVSVNPIGDGNKYHLIQSFSQFRELQKTDQTHCSRFFL